ncbi:MAG: hypothetical protein WD066_13695 [Planctomycetaceae bacterium]
MALSLGLLWIVSPWLQVTRTRSQASVILKDEVVGFRSAGDGMITVRLDGKEETIAESELESSEPYQEAIKRLGHAATARLGELGEQYEEWSWYRVRRYYLPLVVLLFIALFVVWKPRGHDR